MFTKNQQIKTISPQEKNNLWFLRYPKTSLLALNVVIFTVVIIGIELIARIFRPDLSFENERHDYWKYDTTLGWVNSPNKTGYHNHIDFSVRVEINSEGFRDSEYPIQRTRKKRMLILGDSFGWGFGVEHSERFSELIEHNHPDWEIINASVSGYGTDQEYLLYLTRGQKYHPDIVLLLFCENDFGNNDAAEQYFYYKPYYSIEHDSLVLHNIPVPKETIRQRLFRIGQQKSALFIKMYELILGINHAFGQNQSPKESQEVTFHILKALRESCTQNGAELVMVTVASNDENKSILRSITSELRIPYLHLGQAMENVPVSSRSFPHTDHWNRLGHRVAANAIDSFLCEKRIFKRSAE